jgi:hypothetical protein
MDHTCRICDESITFESINVQTFCKDFDSSRYTSLYDSDRKFFQLPMSTTWKVIKMDGLLFKLDYD